MQNRKEYAKQVYTEITDKLFKDNSEFYEYLKYMGRFFKMPAAYAAIAYAQNPKATVMAEYKTWQAFGYQVKKAEESIAVISEDGILRHLFDITQTTNPQKPPFQWSLNKEIADEFLKQNLNSNNTTYRSITAYINSNVEREAEKTVKGLFSKMSAAVSETKKAELTQSFASMVKAVVIARCEYNSKYKAVGQEYDFSFLEKCSKSDFEKICSSIQTTAKSVLLQMEKSITSIILKKRSENYEQQRQNGERNSDDLGRAGAEALPRNIREKRDTVQNRQGDNDVPGAAQGGDGRRAADRDIRQTLAEVYDGKPSRNADELTRNRALSSDSIGDRQGSGRDVGTSEQAVRNEEPSSSERFYRNGTLGEDEAARNTARDSGAVDNSTERITETAEEHSAVSSVNITTKKAEQMQLFPKTLSKKEQQELDNICLNLKQEISQWENLYIHGDNDPFWQTGCNLMLVTNHIIYYKKQLEEKFSSEQYPPEFFLETPPKITNGEFISLHSGDRIRMDDGTEYKVLEILSEEIDIQVDVKLENIKTGEITAKQLRDIKGKYDNLTRCELVQQLKQEGKFYEFANNEINNDNKHIQEKHINKEAVEKHNYVIADSSFGEGGPKAKYQSNVAAIKLLNELEKTNRLATPEEQKILAGYVGWGGIAAAFDKDNTSWSSEYNELKGLLNANEYESARASTLTAFYTPLPIIESIYKAIEKMGFNGGNVLEPSCATGNFFGMMPEKIAAKSKLHGIELDSISGRIAKQLYQNANIDIKGFEKVQYPDNYFSLAIGNVPFGNYSLSERRYNANHFMIHDHFFAKALDKIAPGGIVAFITSKGTLDKQSPQVREYLAERANLIGAIRLPNDTFKDANGITSDIVFLQKREQRAVEYPDWCYLGKTENGIEINNYFVNHPEMIIGNMQVVSGPFGPESACILNKEKGTLQEQIDTAIASMNIKDIAKKVIQAKITGKSLPKTIPANSDVRNFTYTLINNKFYYRENEIMTEVSEGGTRLERMKGLHNVRVALRNVIEAQSEECSDVRLAELQKELNAIYDGFTSKYGYINDRSNSGVFAEDDDYNLLCALENVDTEKQTITKSAIFSQRTVNPIKTAFRAENIDEALHICLDQRGQLDISYMANLLSEEPNNVAKQLIDEQKAFINPRKYTDGNPFEAYEEASEYLSGDVREKLGIAKAFAIVNPEIYKYNVDALKNALPQTIEASDIMAQIGAAWIDVADYERFLNEYANANMHVHPLRRTRAGEYKIEHKGSDCTIAATSSFGTARMNSYTIFENILNGRNITVKDHYAATSTEPERIVVNKKETQKAAEKARQMKEAFTKWLWKEPQRREKYVERYNKLFNSIVGRKYDGAHQTFPGMSPYIELKEHQKNAIARAKLGGNTLLAHCVGAGKSFEMFATTMEKKRLGLISKACMVVPNALVGQTAAEWIRLYPGARLLAASEKDFSKDNRQRFISRCVTGDYDAVIMSYEQFEKIQMSQEYQIRFLQEQKEDLVRGIEDADRSDRRSVKDLERMKKQIEAKITKLLETSKTKDTQVNFEELGIDYVVIDEAHNYKNGLIVSKMTNVAGVQSSPAQKSEDLLMKTMYLNEKYGYNNLLFATGTPVSNSMVELYTMQNYMRPDLLKKAGIQTFDDWAKAFGEVVSQLELKPAGDGFRLKQRFSKFSNLPELMQMYREFADIQTLDMLALPVPELEGGKPQTVVAQPDALQLAYMQQLAKRSEAIASGAIDPREDNMLKITHEARLLGLDPRAINPDVEENPDGKVNLCINNIMETYNSTSEQKGVQAVFCDIAVNGDNGKFSVYDNIKSELVKRGVPENEICFAGDAKNKTQRNEMQAQLRAGTKRIVIASTSKLGTGANIQTRLAALHHLDIPWRPSDLEQRNGRILRQGNMFPRVKVYNYVTEKTFDAYMLSIIVNKQKYISQVMTGKSPARTSEDVDELVLNYSEMQAIASGDPRIKEKIELDGEVSRLRMLESEHLKNLYELQDKAKELTQKYKSFDVELEKTQIDLDFIRKNPPSEDFLISINNKQYIERKEAGAALRNEITRVMVSGESKMIGEYCGFKLGIERVKSDYSYGVGEVYANVYLLGKAKHTCRVELDNDIGNITRLENVVKFTVEKKTENYINTMHTVKANIEEAERTMNAPFELANELEIKSKRLDVLNSELSGKSEEPVFDENQFTQQSKEPNIEMKKCAR